MHNPYRFHKFELYKRLMPFLSNIRLPPIDDSSYLQSIPSFKNGLDLRLTKNVTFLVGENGSGKSTLLEGIADQCGFSLRGGNRNHLLGQDTAGYESPLGKHLHLTWTPRRITNGFFMRAESFFNFASYIDEVAKSDPRVLNAYGGKSLHQQSHGESFLSLFNNQFTSGIYILDEPEAALSPARILAFISVIHELQISERAQFIIATHSPMLICYPDAAVFEFSDSGVQQTTYQETEHFQLTKSFLDNPALYLRHLYS